MVVFLYGYQRFLQKYNFQDMVESVHIPAQ